MVVALLSSRVHTGRGTVKCLHKVLAANFAPKKVLDEITDRYRSFFHSDRHADRVKASLFHVTPTVTI
jgi:hypothetical protein